MAYAENTSVSVDRSRDELSRILQRHGANGFRYAWQDTAAGREECVEFVCNQRLIRFVLKLPGQHEKQFSVTPGRQRTRSEAERIKAWEQACRTKWRALVLAVKAKLEAIDAMITEFDAEFLAHIVDPGTNRTVGQVTLPQIAQRYEGKGDVLIGLPAPK